MKNGHLNASKNRSSLEVWEWLLARSEVVEKFDTETTLDRRYQPARRVNPRSCRKND